MGKGQSFRPVFLNRRALTLVQTRPSSHKDEKLPGRDLTKVTVGVGRQHSIQDGGE
jgi:hypothetical protein